MGEAKRRRDVNRRAMNDGSLWAWYPPDYQGDPAYGPFERVAGAIAEHLAEKQLVGENFPLHLVQLSDEAKQALDAKIRAIAQPILAEIRESCERSGRYEFDHIYDCDGELVEYAEIKRVMRRESVSMMHRL